MRRSKAVPGDHCPTCVRTRPPERNHVGITSHKGKYVATGWFVFPLHTKDVVVVVAHAGQGQHNGVGEKKNVSIVEEHHGAWKVAPDLDGRDAGIENRRLCVGHELPVRQDRRNP